MFKLIKFIIGFVIFLVIAVIIFGIVIIVLNRGNKPKKVTFTSTKKVSEVTSFDINVDVKDSYVKVIKSKTDYVSITYYESKTREFERNEDVDLLNNDTMTLKGYQTGSWYNRIFLTLKTTKVYGITIEMPDYANVSVKTDNGNIRFESIYAGTITAETTNGAIFFDKVECGIASVDTINGEIKASSTNTTYLFNARTRKGKITLTSLVSLLNIDARTDSGKIHIENSYAQGSVKLHSGNGDIDGFLKLLSDAYYKITAKAHNGKCNLTNSEEGITTLEVTTDNGNIDLELRKVIA